MVDTDEDPEDVQREWLADGRCGICGACRFEDHCICCYPYDPRCLQYPRPR